MGPQSGLHIQMHACAFAVATRKTPAEAELSHTSATLASGGSLNQVPEERLELLSPLEPLYENYAYYSRALKPLCSKHR